MGVEKGAVRPRIGMQEMAQPVQGERTPVVVVGEGLNCLGIIRSLAREGVACVAVTASRHSVVGCSRSARAWPLAGLEGPALIEGLVELAAELRRGRDATAADPRPVLMLGGDRQVALASEARERLEPHYRLSLPPAARVLELADKASFQRFAEIHGLPVPRTEIVDDPQSLARLDELRVPLVVKPSDKARVLEGQADRAVRAETHAQARAAAARMVAAAGSVVAQEWIEGDDSDIYFALFVADRASRILGMFCGRKLVCTPPLVGSTAICAPAGEHAQVVARLAAQFVSETGYRGIGGIEFKLDRRSGRFLIVEPTVGRTDWQSEVATLNGVNLPWLAMLEALDEAPPSPPQGAADVPQEGAAPGVAWRASLRFRRPRGGQAAGLRFVDGYFRLSDPLPGLYHYGVEAFLQRIARRLARLLPGARGTRTDPSIQRSASPP